jgi:hypothetical protein
LLQNVSHDNVHLLILKKQIMPKQKGTHRILGTTGDMTYNKTKDGYSVKEKLHISADRIRTAPGYARTRENMAEFARAGKATKLLRTAFFALIANSSDSRMTSRLLTRFLRIIKTDPVSDRGLRSVTLGDMGLLNDFDFNSEHSLVTAFHTPFTATVNRQTGLCSINVAAFDTPQSVAVPEGATHYRLVAGAAELDFENEHYTSDFKTSADFPLGNSSNPGITISPQLAAQSTLPIVVVLGIQFFLATNAKMYPLNKSFNALGLVQLNIPALLPL